MAHRMKELKPEHCYTKAEVDRLIEEAIEEAMAKHNRNASLISMTLGLICLALFVDGLLRILGIIPPFMDLDVNVVDNIIDKVESDVLKVLK